MGNGGDAVFVPQRRQNWPNQERQPGARQLRSPAIELGNADFTEIIESDGASCGPGSATPNRRSQTRLVPGAIRTGLGGRGEFAQDKIPAAPRDKSATGERVSTIGIAGEHTKQSGDPPASRRIEAAAEHGDDRG